MFDDINVRTSSNDLHQIQICTSNCTEKKQAIALLYIYYSNQEKTVHGTHAKI